jgi:hypothetical protein
MKQLRDRLIALRDHANQGYRSEVIRLMQESPLHYMVLIEVSIAYLHEGRSINFENLVKQLHSGLGSRSTIASVLEDYIYKKFMVKKQCKEDKRWRVYEPTKVALQELNRYLERRHRMLREVA